MLCTALEMSSLPSTTLTVSSCVRKFFMHLVREYIFKNLQCCACVCGWMGCTSQLCEGPCYSGSDYIKGESLAVGCK